jgi:flagellar protein FlbD
MRGRKSAPQKLLRPVCTGEGGDVMIKLTKRNHEKFLVNHLQIECIEMIPESKIVMMNRDYFIVRETPEEIVAKIAEYTAKVKDVYREITVSDAR